MIEPPSKQLRETLLRLRVCTAADFRRAKRRVRRLSRDLPAFDFVWIDALLQTRRITPFQARLLESNKHDRLAVGSYVLLDRLGESQHSSTYLARPIASAERTVLKLIDPPDESVSASIASVENLALRLKDLSHPSVAAPQAVFEHDRKLVLVSRYIPGPHLGALLVRRGRFPAPVVAEIARQIVEGLAELEARDCIHGELALNNIRLTTGGAAVLVDPGIRPATSPELIIQAHRAPDRYDGIAPELIGTGAVANVASDIYALGCLLWHLLAGRPPHHTGDPLGKLAAHQTRSIPDVREIAPDTPAELADAIALFTRSDPKERPASFQVIRKAWGAPRRNTRKIIARFLANFDAEASTTPGPAVASNGTWAFLVAGMFVLTGVALTLFDLGAANSKLRISGRIAEAYQQAKAWADREKKPREDEAQQARIELTRRDEPDRAALQIEASPLAVIPTPDRDGFIRLEPGIRYEAESINGVGPLVIQGDVETPPEIVVSARPFQVAARELTIQDVRFRYVNPVVNPNGAPAKGATTLVLAQSQRLTVIGCTFLTQAFENERGAAPNDKVAHQQTLHRPPIGIAWKPIDALDRAGGGVQLLHSLFAGVDAMLHLAGRASVLDLANSLQVGGGTCVSLASGIGSGRELPLRFQHVTLRGVESVVRLRTAGKLSETPRIALAADDSVLDLKGGSAALFQIVGDRNPAELTRPITMTGDGSLANPDVRVTAWIKSGAPTTFPELENVEVEGVSATSFRFAGLPTLSAAESMLDPTSFHASRRSSLLPGVDATALLKRMLPDENDAQPAERAEAPATYAP
ncbi:MAG: serine/threonine protein kinase [Planctomycetaceae bacterium]